MARTMLPTNVSRLSLDSLYQEYHLGEDTEAESSHSKTEAQPFAGRRSQSIRQSIADIRESRVSLRVWLLVTLLSLAVLVLTFRLWRSAVDRWFSSACSADGSFNPIVYNPNPWSASDFFQINLAMGNLSFAEAKIADTAWGLGVGRIGQAGLALITWKVFAEYVSLSMTIQPVTFATYRTIFTEAEPSLISTSRLLYDFVKYRGLASKQASIFVIYSMVVILAWSTLASSTTGYTPLTQAFVRDYDDNLVSFVNFKPVGYIIHDISRINDTLSSLIGIGVYDIQFFEDNPGQGDPNYVISDRADSAGSYSTVPSCYSFGWPEKYNCSIQSNISQYVKKYGFFGLLNKSSIFMGSLIDPPTLNIEACYLPDYYRLYGREWADPRRDEHSTPFNNVSKLTWQNSNRTYQLKDLEDRGVCLPVKDRYQWGASFIQLFILFIILSIWAIGCLIMWIWSHPRLLFSGQNGPPMGYQALGLLVKCLNEQLADDKPKLSELTDREAKTEIRKHLAGGLVSFGPSVQTQTFRPWCRKERVWLLILSVFVISTLALPFVTWHLIADPDTNTDYYALAFPAAFSTSEGLLFAIAVGKTRGSRLTLALCWALLGVVISFSIAASVFY
ncbi:hypothetical protein F4825DRAFT_448225 [Nemania diffusa]|nr:hypothetical protein F4825DRAFT_448225 [Nemania diffusa]